MGRSLPPLFASAKGGRGAKRTQGVHTPPKTPITQDQPSFNPLNPSNPGSDRVRTGTKGQHPSQSIIQITVHLTSVQHLLYINNQGRQTGRP